MNIFSLARRLRLLLLVIPLQIATASSLPSAAQIDQVMGRLSAISGMPVRHRLRFQSISRPEVARYLERRTAETVRPEDLEKEQAALEFLGLLPEGFVLQKTMLALMTEQAAAFYDYDKRSLFLTDWAQPALRDTAAVHELAHALADQNYNLGRYSRRAANSGEESSARQAVIESQASYLMLAYSAEAPNKTDAALHPQPTSFDDAVAPTNGQFPIFDRAPLYVRMGLVFPYTWGLAFQSALIDRLGPPGFAAPFRHPPANTREIMHPEVYFAREKPPRSLLPPAPRGYRRVFESELGELDHRVLIQQFASLQEAKRISPAWRAGRFRIVQNKRDQRSILLYASEWSSPATAASFLAVYRKCLEGKSKVFTIQNETSNGWTGRNDRGYFKVTLSGSRVDSIEGSRDPL